MNTRAIKTILIPGSPIEMTEAVFQYLDIERLRLLSSTSTTWRQECQQYAQNNFQQTYFAVGMPIELNIKYYTSTRHFRAHHVMTTEYHKMISRRESFSNIEIMHSLTHKSGDMQIIRIFTNYDQANKFAQFNSKTSCFDFIDRVDTYQNPAIYMVKINNVLMQKPRNYLLQDQLADLKGLSYQYRKGVEMQGTEIRADNCEKVLFAKLKTAQRTHFFALGNYMDKTKELWEEFSQCWEEEIKDKKQYNEKIISQAVIKLFGGYAHPFFAYTTKHHQAYVNNIIEFMHVSPAPTLIEILGVLKSFRMKIDLDENGDKNSPFSQILDFAMDKLTDLNEANKLMESKSYFNCGS